jgi:hypothetical protein
LPSRQYEKMKDDKIIPTQTKFLLGDAGWKRDHSDIDEKKRRYCVQNSK